MLIFLKNLLSDVYANIHEYFPRWYQKAALVGIVVVVLILLLGCSPATRVAPAIEGPGYCTWQGAPAWMAKDIISNPKKFGLIDGFEFVGKHGLPCYALKIDKPPADGTCDTAAVICETGNTDDRWGPGTPLVTMAGQVPCDEFEGLVEAIKKDEKIKEGV